MAKKIFDSSIHPYQAQTLAISKELRYFFKKNIITPSNFENAQVEINGFYMI